MHQCEIHNAFSASQPRSTSAEKYNYPDSRNEINRTIELDENIELNTTTWESLMKTKLETGTRFHHRFFSVWFLYAKGARDTACYFIEWGQPYADMSGKLHMFCLAQGKPLLVIWK